MGLKKFINNLRYLSRYNLKEMNNKINNPDYQNIYTTVNKMMDNYIYELPDSINAIDKPKIKNYDETIDELINTNASFCRFGDGELFLINNESIHFQHSDPKLAKRLLEILQSNDPSLLIGINYQYFYADLTNFLDYVKFIYRACNHHVRDVLIRCLLKEKQYYTAGITGVYMTFEEYDFESYYKKIQQIWQDKDITIICGERTFNNIDYNIFESAKSINYIYAPQKHAFDKYDSILKAALAAPNNHLFIIMLGPTAKVITYDLMKNKRRALDLGHLYKDYDAYRKNVTRDKVGISKFFDVD